MIIPHTGIRTREAPLYGPGILPADASRPHTYEGVTVGELMGPIAYQVKEETHRKSCEMLEIYHRWFWDESPWGPALLLPCETWCQARVLSRWKYGPMNRQLWTSAAWEFYKPAFVGQKLNAWLRVVDKYWKRGKPCVLTECWSEDESGEAVHRGTEELLLLLSLPPDMKLRGGDERSSQGQSADVGAPHGLPGPAERHDDPTMSSQRLETPRKATPSLQASRETPVGFVLPGRSWAVGFRRAWDPEHWVENVHRADGARQHGFKDALPEGDHVMSKLIESLIGFFGEEWYRSGRASVKVLPMYRGEVLRQRCVIRGKAPERGGTRFDLDVAMVKEDGTPGIVGTASCIIP